MLGCVRWEAVLGCVRGGRLCWAVSVEVGCVGLCSWR